MNKSSLARSFVLSTRGSVAFGEVKFEGKGCLVDEMLLDFEV